MNLTSYSRSNNTNITFHVGSQHPPSGNTCFRFHSLFPTFCFKMAVTNYCVTKYDNAFVQKYRLRGFESLPDLQPLISFSVAYIYVLHWLLLCVGFSKISEHRRLLCLLLKCNRDMYTSCSNQVACTVATFTVITLGLSSRDARNLEWQRK
jgi:hypothetical protein